MLTIFANIRINDEDGLQHLKDSFRSFDTISDDWLINVRGTLRREAIDFLKANLRERMTLFELLDDSRGWINNALQMLPKAKYDYLLIWNEDHLSVASQDKLRETIEEVIAKRVDYLLYSWWMFGRGRNAFNTLPLDYGKHVDTLELTKEIWNEARLKGYPYYLLSLCGVYRKEFFERLLRGDRVKLPMFFTKNLYRVMTLLNRLGLDFSQKKYFHLINKLCFHKLRRFIKETPFDLEKAPDRIDILPFRLALAKEELFACIDDDLDIPGYQLIKRGKYPIFISLPVTTDEKEWGLVGKSDRTDTTQIFLPKGERYRRAYYEDAIRTKDLLEESLIVVSGNILLEEGGERVTLPQGKVVVVYPNIGYTVTAIEDSDIKIIAPPIEGKKIYYVGIQGNLSGRL